MRAISAIMFRTQLLLACCLSALLLECSAGRWDIPIPERSGRQLLDISFNATGTNVNSTLTVFALSNFNATSPCIFQGYPGSRADMVVPGPLVINVPVGTTAQINFGPLTSGGIVALYNQTANNTLTTSFNGTYGLISTTFKANDSSLIGRSAYITGGRVDNYNNSIPERSWNSQPVCLVNVTFVVVPYIPPPPPTPAPAPQPPTEATPPSPSFLSGLLGGFQLPKNPCFCTPVVGGKATCFNFNAASSDVNCAPDSNYSCTSVEAPAGLFTQQSGPVFDCTVGSVQTAG